MRNVNASDRIRSFFFKQMEQEKYNISTILLNNETDTVKFQTHNSTTNEIKKDFDFKLALRK